MRFRMWRWVALAVPALAACGAPDQTAARAETSPPAGTARLVVSERRQLPLIGPSGYAVASIADIVATATRDRIVVVEDETNSLLVLSADGRPLSFIAKTGHATSWLVDPVQVAWANQHELIVLDAQKPRLARFALREDALALSTMVSIEDVADVSSVCSMHGKTFVMGKTRPLQQTKLIHVVAETGTITQSFGDGFGPRHEAAKRFYGVGRLLCLPNSGLILATSRYHPDIQAYDERGTLRWTRSIPGYLGIAFEETSPGRITYVYPDGELWDSTVSSFQAADGVVAVQVARWRGRAVNRRLERMHTLLLDEARGSMMNMQTDLPLVRSAGADRLFALDQSQRVWLLSHSLVK